MFATRWTMYSREDLSHMSDDQSRCALYLYARNERQKKKICIHILLVDLYLINFNSAKFDSSSLLKRGPLTSLISHTFDSRL